MFLCFNLGKTCCSEGSRFKVGSSLSFSNLEVSKIISSIALLQGFRSKMTTPFPLSGFVIPISLFFLRFRKTRFWSSVRREGLQLEKQELARYERCAFIWLLVYSDSRLLRNERWIFSKVVKISHFRVLSKSDSFIQILTN